MSEEIVINKQVHQIENDVSSYILMETKSYWSKIF